MFKTFLLCIAICILSCVYYFFANEWIIIRWPLYSTISCKKEVAEQAFTQEKEIKIKLFFWHYSRWNYESRTLQSSNREEIIKYILRSLLTLLEEERVLEKKIKLQSVMQSPSGNDIYLSFDGTPFNVESSTLDKLMIIEGILKTLRENHITAANIYFLVHHQPMNDVHLDFSHAWPLEGFFDTHKNTI